MGCKKGLVLGHCGLVLYKKLKGREQCLCCKAEGNLDKRGEMSQHWGGSEGWGWPCWKHSDTRPGQKADGWKASADVMGGRGAKGNRGQLLPGESQSRLCWLAVPAGADSGWSHILLPHGDVVPRPLEREVPAGGLHGGAEW